MRETQRKHIKLKVKRVINVYVYKNYFSTLLIYAALASCGGGIGIFLISGELSYVGNGHEFGASFQYGLDALLLSIRGDGNPNLLDGGLTPGKYFAAYTL